MDNAADVSAGVRLLDIPDKGRGIVSTQKFPAGHAIYATIPEIAVLYGDFVKQRCSLCFSSAQCVLCDICEKYATCSQCIRNSAAQKIHSIECAMFCELPEDVRVGDTDYVRFVLRYAALKRLDDPRIATIRMLCTNRAIQSGSFIQWANSYASLFVGFFGERLCLTHQELIDLLCIVQANALGFPFDSQATSGWCLQSIVGLLNHSCVPNCCIAPIAENSSQMVVRAVADIDVGEELTIAYLQADDGDTREALYDRYRFYCECPKCAVK